MGFKDFCKNADKSKGVKQEKVDEKKVEEIFNSYKDMGENELLSELFKNIQKQKQDGTYNYNAIKEVAEKMSPFLSHEQNARLKQLLNEIK